MHSAQKSGRSVGCQASVRGNGYIAWKHSWLFYSIWGLYFKINSDKVHDWWCSSQIKFKRWLALNVLCYYHGRGSWKKFEHWCAVWYFEESCPEKTRYQNYHYFSNYECLEVFSFLWRSSHIWNSRKNLSCPKIFLKSCSKRLRRCSSQESCSYPSTTTSRRHPYFHDWSIRYRVHLYVHSIEARITIKCSLNEHHANLFST